MKLAFKRKNSGFSLQSESIDYYNQHVRDNPLQAVLSWIISSGRRLKPFKAVLSIFYLGKVPGLRRIIPWLNPDKNCINYLPVNKSLESGGNMVLSLQVLYDIIEKASVFVRMNQCGCRLLGECKVHDHNIGCVFMGETALNLPHGVSKRITREEAREHIKKGIADGLVPMTGKVSLDNFIYMTPDRRKLLAICFCCPCCCILTSYKHVPAKYLDGIIEPIKGLVIEVNNQCTGCGTCIATCPFDAISLVEGKAVHTDGCRGCGRCEAYCPEGAVTITIDNENYPNEIKARIDSYVEY